ncbi:hypothetical protein A3860_34615 [Niastella vici]|uniref:Resolvase/invertase-type recombinase catalytic domain-containing protein n=1 Tax=Niastella vici TaxID=1703345 RepID=A0A1V9FP72_9BACT|nr:hypothetical protein [Niastella vici]OQP60066.1 hypothetical protein A3860_34615 [Niastella vici]
MAARNFSECWDYIKKNKEKVTNVLVYLIDRFSRSGDGAMRLSKVLRENYGVTFFHQSHFPRILKKQTGHDPSEYPKKLPKK